MATITLLLAEPGNSGEESTRKEAAIREVFGAPTPCHELPIRRMLLSRGPKRHPQSPSLRPAQPAPRLPLHHDRLFLGGGAQPAGSGLFPDRSRRTAPGTHSRRKAIANDPSLSVVSATLREPPLAPAPARTESSTEVAGQDGRERLRTSCQWCSVGDASALSCDRRWQLSAIPMRASQFPPAPFGHFVRTPSPSGAGQYRSKPESDSLDR